jgi:hypothetical protein
MNGVNGNGTKNWLLGIVGAIIATVAGAAMIAAFNTSHDLGGLQATVNGNTSSIDALWHAIEQKTQSRYTKEDAERDKSELSGKIDKLESRVWTLEQRH